MSSGFSENVSSRPRRGRFRSIQTRLAVLLSVLFAIVIVVVEVVDFFGIPFIPYSGRWGQTKLEAIKDLNLIADLKTERLRAWIVDSRKDVRVLATNSARVEEVTSLLRTIRGFEEQGLQGEALWARVRQQADYVELAARLKEIDAAYPDYRRVFIADSEHGRIIASGNESDLGTTMRQQASFASPPNAEGEYVGDVVKVPGYVDPVFHISRRLGTLQRKAAAVVVVEIRVEELLQPILHAGESLRFTEDTVLVNREGYILMPLKYPLPDGTMPEPLEYRITAEPAALAARGEEGIIEAPDYRGVPVVAACRFVRISPELGWGLVVKRSRAEVLAPLFDVAMRHVGIALAGMLALVILSFAVARGVTRPLRDLAGAANRVANGDLTVRAPVTTRDEVGDLAATFNAMVQRVADSREALLRQERLATLGRLTATVSHEIRNPLGTLRTTFFIIAQKVRGKELGLEPALDRIERSILRCDRIIADLLDYSRNREPQLQDTDVDRWLGAVLDEYELPARIALTRDLGAGATLPLDQERLRRALLNLLTNACHAMEPDGGQLTVASRRQDHRLVIRIGDTGCGIPPDVLERIFEPLYSTKSFGVGLGLAIVQQIVEQHHGRIEVDSQPGRGTTFSIYLPTDNCPLTTDN